MVEVSIIIPTKNNEDILEKCLKSIKQTLEKFDQNASQLDYPKDRYEVIIVDGHSTDNTVEIAKKYGCKIMYEDIGTRGGACNIGVRNAEGEFVVFTDADCVVRKDWLNNLIKHFNSEKVASVGGPNITPEDDTELAKCAGDDLTFLSQTLGKFDQQPFRKRLTKNAAPASHIGPRYASIPNKPMEIFHNPTCNVAYRKEVIKEVGEFNEKLVNCEDEELDYRIKERGYKIFYTPDVRVLHYRRPTWKKFYKDTTNIYGKNAKQRRRF